MDRFIAAAKRVNTSIPIHLELASSGSLSLIRELATQVLPQVDSMGLNEQELGYLHFAITRPAASYSEASEYVSLHFKDPELATVEQALKDVFEYVHRQPGARKLERIHFHYLKYHLIAQTEDSSWLSPRAGVVAGSLEATLQACGRNNSQYLEWEHMEVLYPVDNPKEPYRHWRADGIHFHLAPLVACKYPVGTVGLGDTISASGLSQQRRAAPQ